MFLFIEKKTAQALIPQGALSGKVGFILGCMTLGWSSFGIWVYYFFQIIENLRNVTPLEGAAQTIPAGISGCAAALTTGYILSRLRTSYVMAIAMLGFCIGNILLATAPVNQTYWANFFVATVVTPWGMDMSFPCCYYHLERLRTERASRHCGVTDRDRCKLLHIDWTRHRRNGRVERQSSRTGSPQGLQRGIVCRYRTQRHGHIAVVGLCV